ncbi:alternative ribosome rescue aminoacyl-tRNA hydrolase ArfB [Mucilaginibacter paludis]|uniref:Class I peptide chain release factor n=1 Tax=Mucilaginibacter paludis DSM 18603 TaxID=714943 RepID=H1Y7S5_9SPHI|nr:alternative ribosome rescue aminoacyl-tRNA hydrolase ArfB [Mucilaginibacter paludis]EHQ29920.1 Class I peptide chain release factor [Mucilaginibacter paludis DSM 18603]
MTFTKTDLQRDVHFKTSRSGGKGGQNVNKVSSKVELLFSIQDSTLFTDEQKLLLSTRLQSRLSKDGFLQVICDEERSQYLNKETALDKLNDILTRALHQPKKRKASKPSKASKLARLDDKRRAALKKINRKRDYTD